MTTTTRADPVRAGERGEAAGEVRTLVLGLGNPILGDDGVGPAVAREIAVALARRSDVVVEEAAADGFELLDMVAGYSSLVLIDAIPVGEGGPGTVHRLRSGELLATRRAAALHEVNLVTALRLAQRFGIEVPARIVIYAVEAEVDREFRDGLSPAVAAAVPAVAERILKEIGAPGRLTVR